MLIDRQLAWHLGYYPLGGIKCSIEASGIQTDGCRALDISVLLLQPRQASPPARQPVHRTGSAL